MTEKLLQFIWQHLYFNQGELRSIAGERVQIIKQGTLNRDQGPDFSDARIVIDGITYAGHVELHVKSSDWVLHGHATDPRYDNVILHVVWKHDKDIPISFPAVSLQDRIYSSMLAAYNKMIDTNDFLPCGTMVRIVDDTLLQFWKTRLFTERLQVKFDKIRGSAALEPMMPQLLYEAIAAALGGTRNAELFVAAAKQVTLQILRKESHRPVIAEALLLGQCNLLAKITDDPYPKMLQREYHFLQKKYCLKSNPFLPDFLRMRPANFPTLRLAQLASLMNSRPQLFNDCLQAASVNDLKKLFIAEPNDYWLYHYSLADESAYKPKPIGNATIRMILSNAVFPILYGYANMKQDEPLMERVLQFANETAGEENRITKGFQHYGLANKSAFDSQSLIRLYKHYCSEKRCTECAIGNAILKGEGRGGRG